MCAKKQTSVKAQSLPGGDSATTATRPRRKADSVVKGSLHKWEGTDYAEFHPVRGKDEPTREMLKQVGNSTFYKNLGKKESSYTLHVNVDGESQDPVAEIYEIMDVLTKEQRKTLPKLPEGSQGRMLFDNNEGLQIWLDSETKKLTIMAQLECTADIERQLLQAEAQMNVVVGRNRKDIINNSNK
jgi:hypothetical protein